MNAPWRQAPVTTEGLPLHVRERPGEPGAPRLLALHGWLDHGHSFDLLAEHLPASWHLALLDFRGQGQSGHLPPGAQYGFGDYLLDVEATLDALGWERAHLLGHSLGGIVAVSYAAARPDRVASLTLIESLGPRGGAPERAVERLRESIASAKRAPNRKVYPSVEVAASRLRESNPTLPEAAALHLARFGTEPVEGGVAFTFDPRHRRTFALAHDEAQVLAIMRAVRAPTRLIMGTSGPRFAPEMMQARREALRVEGPHAVEGGHHVHLEQPEAVARLVAGWISQNGSGSGSA